MRPSSFPQIGDDHSFAGACLWGGHRPRRAFPRPGASAFSRASLPAPGDLRMARAIGAIPVLEQLGRAPSLGA